MTKKKKTLHDTAATPEAVEDDMEVAVATSEVTEDYAENYMEAAAAAPEVEEEFADDYMAGAAAASEFEEEDIDEAGLWLEIDGETIIGVHNYRCESDLTWIKYEGEGGEDIMPGQLWKNNKVVVPTVEFTAEDIQAAATQHINEAYPTWKQLNIIREGNKEEIDKMSRFIDAVRDWSNKPKAKIENLKKIKP